MKDAKFCRDVLMTAHYVLRQSSLQHLWGRLFAWASSLWERCSIIDIRSLWVTVVETWTQAIQKLMLKSPYLPNPSSLNGFSKVLWRTRGSKDRRPGLKVHTSSSHVQLSWADVWGMTEPTSSFIRLCAGINKRTCFLTVALSGPKKKDRPMGWLRQHRSVCPVSKSHSHLPEISPSVPPFRWHIASERLPLKVHH